MEKIIKSIENKFVGINKKMELLIEKAKLGKVLLTELDLKTVLNLDNDEYDLLIHFANVSDLNENQVKRLINLNDVLSNQVKYIDLINHDVILKTKNVTRDQIYYMLNRKSNDKERHNVIINVNSTNNDVVEMKEILKDKE